MIRTSPHLPPAAAASVSCRPGRPRATPRRRGGKSLDTYTPLSDRSGDPASIRDANRAAVESAAVVQQVLVGQFWADPAFQSAYQQALRTL